MVSESTDEEGQSDTYNYTRDGGFTIDNNGNLTSANGYKVMGYTEGTPTLEDGFAGFNMEEGTDLYLSAIQIQQRATVQDENGNDVQIELQDYNIDNTGTIIATYSDGNTYVLGRLALANFANPDGLEKAGSNMYNATTNSGAPAYKAPSEDGYGVVRSGFVEMSNVDLASEFTEMIVASRAYQANSRSITTSDEMLQELINLKR